MGLDDSDVDDLGDEWAGAKDGGGGPCMQGTLHGEVAAALEAHHQLCVALVVVDIGSDLVAAGGATPESAHLQSARLSTQN